MKILFAWTGVTSYMADCWRTLQAVEDVDLRVVVDPLSAAQTSFKAEREFHGLNYQLARVGDDVKLGGWIPDVIFLVGWSSPLCRWFAEDVQWRAIPKVCCLDMPWRRKFRCLVAPLFLRRYARKFAGAFVPGRFCEQYCNWIGFRRVWKGLFGIDTTRFGDCRSAWKNPSIPYFLYLGRYSQEKRLGDLVAAYRAYRRAGGMYALRLYGKGMLPAICNERVDGVEIHDFIAPSEVPLLMHESAAFVLASDFDPWPLVLVEAMSAGCRIVASDKCTNWPELGKNWMRFRCGDVEALARKLREVEALPLNSAMSRENRKLALQYDCANWVKRVQAILSEVLK